ncbi:hypothetical protein GA0070606_6090 [Micromonospora citrea]|uniref:Uncharacterized protein n=1 Tax=Micromonospora citrea TaxID=47855 RepID=A0A1C6W2K7_9ACTN|nr:hypothetical protein [Micromonospora citrea]SCL72400.1 hypothetical protein GA0070606_6090 [Micromonospora citrea]
MHEQAGGADWPGRNLVHLALAQAKGGDTTLARQTLTTAESIATAAASRRLAREVTETVHRLGLSATP